MKKEQQEVERFAHSFNKSEFDKQSRQLKDVEKTLNEFRNLALEFTETLPEDYSKILKSVDTFLSSQLGGKGIPSKVAEAMGLGEKYNFLLSFEQTLSNEYLLNQYGQHLSFKPEEGYRFTQDAYDSLKEHYTGYLTDTMEIDLYKRIEAIIQAYTELTKEMDGGMWMDSIYKFGNSSRMFSMPVSFRISPNVSYIRSRVSAKKKSSR